MKKWLAVLVLGFSTIVSANGLQEDFQNRVSAMNAEFVLYETKTGTMYDKDKVYTGHGNIQYQNNGFITHYDKWMGESTDRALFGNQGEVWVWENDTKEGALLADKHTPFVHALMPFENIQTLKKEFNFSYGKNTVTLIPKNTNNETSRVVFNFKKTSQDCNQGKPDCLNLLSVYVLDKYKNTSLYIFKDPKYNIHNKKFLSNLTKLEHLSSQ